MLRTTGGAFLKPPVTIKVARGRGQVLNVAPEFEDCRRIAGERGVALKEVYAAAIAAWRNA